MLSEAGKATMSKLTNERNLREEIRKKSQVVAVLGKTHTLTSIRVPIRKYICLLSFTHTHMYTHISAVLWLAS